MRSKQRLSLIEGWITGVAGSSAVSGSVTAGSSSYVDLRPARRRPRPRRACARPRRRPPRPAQQARSTAMACCGADLSPLRCVSTPTHGVMTLASSAPVTTAMTPGDCFAAVVSIDAILRVRVRRAHEGDMRHARQHHVADILRAPLRQPRQVRSRHRAADIGIRPVERGQHGRRIVDDFHFAARACATASMASMMA